MAAVSVYQIRRRWRVVPLSIVDQADMWIRSACPGTGHCSDLHAPRDTDPEVVKALRKRFEGYLYEWLTA